jgi:protein-disulfide isomerase
MEIHRMDDDRWVSERLAALEPDSAWQPDAEAALEGFRNRRSGRHARRRNTILLTAAGALVALVFADITPRACANPRGCDQPAAADRSTDDPPSVPKLNPSQFKLQGDPRAAVTLEVYSDYQCPDCMAFFRDVFPLLNDRYIKTGKIQFLHRDFPLPQHAYAKLAARYANAAGEIGKYDAVVNAIFRARNDWSIDGNIAAAVAKALTPEDMKSVQRAVDFDAHLDDTVAGDMAMAQKDRINHTPMLVIVSKSGREALAYNVSFRVLESYLDAVLAR